MKLTEHEWIELAILYDNIYVLTKKSFLDRIESILSRPEQGGEEDEKLLIEEARQFIIEQNYPGWANHTLAPNWMASFAQLRTAQLRSELDEKKREIEKFKQYRLVYEYDLPDDISSSDYKDWYEHSLIIDGVRMGYNLKWIKENFN